MLIFQQFRQCALAILNTGSEIDDAAEMLEQYKDFDIQVVLSLGVETQSVQCAGIGIC